MRTLKILAFLLAAVSLSVLDEESFYTVRIEQVIQRWHSPVTYRSIGDGWFEFRDTLSGKTFRQLVADARTYGGKQPKKIITIDVTKIDTTGFGVMFTKLTSIPAGVQNIVPVGFHAKDGSVHFIAAKFLNGTYASTDFYKWEPGKDTLDNVGRLSGNWLYPFAQGTFFPDNLPNIAVDSFGTVMVFDTRTNVNLPTRKRAIRYGRNESAQKPRVYDFDSNGLDEIVMRQWPPLNSIITKYDTSLLTFRDVFANNFKLTMEWGSWAVGDFDFDRKGEFAIVTRGGFVYFVENGENDSTYLITFTDTTRAQNAGFNYEGDDLDGDGRPECFLGSLFFGGLVNIAVYETIGNNDYEVSLWIEIKGISALKRGLVTGDVDGDGRDELVVNLGGVVMILKAIAENHYEMMWMKTFRYETGVCLFDVDEDGTQELIIGQEISDEPYGGYTGIFSFSKSLNVDTVVRYSDITIDVYPNPLKSDGSLFITCSQPSTISIDIFSSSGKHVRTLFRGLLDQTQKTITIPMGNMHAGVYFVRLQAGSHIVTKKILLIH